MQKRTSSERMEEGRQAERLRDRAMLAQAPTEWMDPWSQDGDGGASAGAERRRNLELLKLGCGVRSFLVEPGH